MYPIAVNRTVETPREAAQSSPTASKFHCGAYAITSALTPTTTTASQASVEYSTASSPPISQREIAKDCEKLARLWRKRITANAMLFIVTPVSSSVKDDSRRPSTAIPSTINRTRPAPTSEATPVARHPRQIAITAPTDAPLETPSVYGSAKGSRNMH